MALFDVLPADLFKPLAAASRHLYSELLLHLYHRTFELAAEAPRRADVIREIGDFCVRWDAANAHEDDETKGMSPEDRARSVYQRLLDTGWLLEHKDRYIKLVDLDPDASGLLHVLSGISRGETRSYGGAVVVVLSSLENAAANPSERSENLRNAAIGASDFMAHMRTVSVALRKVEERILKQQTLREVFRHFFEDFVERHLIRDFKTLHTKDNPFRFRPSIIRQANRMAVDELLVVALGQAYAKEGRAADPRSGEADVRRDLAHVVAVFESAERHLAAIDATAARVERRIMNTARYMDRVTRRSEASLADAMRTLARMDRAEIGIPSPLIDGSFPFGPAHVPTPRRERPPIEVSEVRRIEKDPAMVLYGLAKEEYVRRTRVTVQSLTAYVERALGSKTKVRGSSIPVESVDDFVAFQRLREIPSIFDGALARRYDIEMLPERCSNDWISCRDFVIRRKEGKRAHAA